MRSTFLSLCTLALLAPAGALAKPTSPVGAALMALEAARPRLAACMGESSARGQVRVRISRTGWLEVMTIQGIEDSRARTCVRVVLEELHLPKEARGGISEMSLPVVHPAQVARR
jgi:hypothetical protein